ncbi:MAG: hypothetical protein V1734_04145 [Nanoarchaeota archaeon]
MGSYKLVKGGKPERYTPDIPGLKGLTGLLARHWNELITTHVPQGNEWECVDVLRDASLAHMTVLAEDNDFDKEKIKFVPFTEEPLLRFRLGSQSEYLQALFSETAAYALVNDSCNHYLVFRKKKAIERERRNFEDEFFEKYGW